MAGTASIFPFEINRSFHLMNTPTVNLMRVKVNEVMSKEGAIYSCRELGQEVEMGDWNTMFDSLMESQGSQTPACFEGVLPSDFENKPFFTMLSDKWDQYPQITETDAQHGVAVYEKGYSAGWLLEEKLPYMHTFAVLEGEVCTSTS